MAKVYYRSIASGYSMDNVALTVTRDVRLNATITATDEDGGQAGDEFVLNLDRFEVGELIKALKGVS